MADRPIIPLPADRALLPFPRSVLEQRPWPKRLAPLPIPVAYDVAELPHTPARRTDLPRVDAAPPPPPWVACEAAQTGGAAVCATWSPLLPEAGDQPGAALGAAALLEQPAGRAAACAWLAAWPEAAAVGLLPTIMGKPSRWQLLAQLALTEAARRHPERVRAVAAAQGATAPRWVERLLADGPVDTRDWYAVRSPPPWAAPATLPAPCWADQTPLSAPQLASFVTRVRRSRLADPYLHLDAVRDACDPASLDRFSAALLAGWIDAGAPEDGAWAAVQVAFWGGPQVGALLEARKASRSPTLIGLLAPLSVPEVRAALVPPAARPPAPAPVPRPFGLTAEERDFGFRRFNGRRLRPDTAAALRRAGWRYDEDRLEHGEGTRAMVASGPDGAEVVLELSHGAFLFRRRAAGALVVGRIGLPGLPRLPLSPTHEAWLDARLTEIEDLLEAPA